MANKYIKGEIFETTAGASFPFVTASVYTGGPAIEYTYLQNETQRFANFLYVKNLSATGNLHVGYSALGVNTNNKYYVVRPGEEVKSPTFHAAFFISGSTSPISMSIQSGWTNVCPVAGNFDQWDDLV